MHTEGSRHREITIYKLRNVWGHQRQGEWHEQIIVHRAQEEPALPMPWSPTSGSKTVRNKCLLYQLSLVFCYGSPDPAGKWWRWDSHRESGHPSGPEIRDNFTAEGLGSGLSLGLGSWNADLNTHRGLQAIRWWRQPDCSFHLLPAWYLAIGSPLSKVLE